MNFMSLDIFFKKINKLLNGKLYKNNLSKHENYFKFIKNNFRNINKQNQFLAITFLLKIFPQPFIFIHNIFSQKMNNILKTSYIKFLNIFIKSQNLTLKKKLNL